MKKLLKFILITYLFFCITYLSICVFHFKEKNNIEFNFNQINIKLIKEYPEFEGANFKLNARSTTEFE